MLLVNREELLSDWPIQQGRTKAWISSKELDQLLSTSSLASNSEVPICGCGPQVEVLQSSEQYEIAFSRVGVSTTTEWGKSWKSIFPLSMQSFLTCSIALLPFSSISGSFADRNRVVFFAKSHKLQCLSFLQSYPGVLLFFLLAVLGFYHCISGLPPLLPTDRWIWNTVYHLTPFWASSANLSVAVKSSQTAAASVVLAKKGQRQLRD